MLELPEAHTIAHQLNQTIKGKQIHSVVAGASPHGFAFFSGDPADYPELLCERTVEEIVPLAGQVEIRAQDRCILFGDGVNIRFYGPGEELPKKHQLLIQLEDNSHVVGSVQMYGGMWAFPAGENDNFYYTVAKEKPTPLTDAFDADYFAAIWNAAPKNLSAKALLATEQRIPGLGNGTLQDILFRSNVHPKSKVAALNQEDRDKLFRMTKETLRDMTIGGGRDTEKDLFGCAGGYKTILSSKTLKQPCPVCGGEIVRQAFLGGNVYFCPNCQPLKK